MNKCMIGKNLMIHKYFKKLERLSSKYLWLVPCDCNRTRTHNHLVRKQTLNRLSKLASFTKWLSVRLQTK